MDTSRKLTFYEKVERRIGDFFAHFGRLVARHPWKIILITIVINLGLGVGLIKLDIVIDAEKVYLPTGSQARDDEKRVQAIFPDLSRSNYQKLQLTEIGKWAAILVKSKTGNLLEGNSLAEISALNDVINNITTTKDDGTEVRLTDICAIYKEECFVEGSVFWSPEFQAAVALQNVSFPFFTTSKGLTNYKTYVGGVVDRNETHLRGMEYIKIEYNYRTDLDSVDSIITWSTEFLKVMENFKGTSIDIYYAHYDSLDEQLNENVLGDLGLYAFTVAIMMAYSIIATISARLTDSVGQRVWLGLAGWTATGLSILSAVGLCVACGVEFVSIVGVAPFLVSGIGVDDMFILLSGLSGAQTQTTISDKLAETMRVSGVGITITTLTDLLAFGCGATSSFVSVRNFCIYTGVSVTFCYINNITIVGGFMAINEARVEQNRHWLTCRRIQTREEAEQDGRDKPRVLCCTGRPPTSRKEAESLLDKVPRWILPKIVLYKPFRYIIVVLFLGYLGGAIYGCVNLKQGIRFSELPTDSSYYYGYAITEERQMPRQTPVSFIIDGHYNYSDPNIQQTINSFMSKVKADKLFENDFEVNWLSAYRSTPYYRNASEQAFIMGLKMFLNNSFFISFQNDVVFDDTGSKIIASRIYGRSINLAGSQEEGNFMLRSRDLADEFELECFAFYPSFILYEQYVIVLTQTLITVGVALGVVLVVTCFFMPHPLMITLCTIAVTLIMTGVIGYMYYIDVALSAITMVQVIMSIGFSVDFTAHICHGYIASHGDTRTIRVKGAIDKTGAPITHGAISSLLGIAVLGAADSYIFRTFATVVAFLLSFAWAHAMLLLPVVLSWLGPGNFESKKTRQRRQRKSRENKSLHRKENGFKPKPFSIQGNGHVPRSPVGESNDRFHIGNQYIQTNIYLPSNGYLLYSGNMYKNGLYHSNGYLNSNKQFPGNGYLHSDRHIYSNGNLIGNGHYQSNGYLSSNGHISDSRNFYNDGYISDSQVYVRQSTSHRLAIENATSSPRDVTNEKESHSQEKGPRSKDRKSDTKFEEKSSVFKIYPDVRTGDVHWEAASSSAGEWIKSLPKSK